MTYDPQVLAMREQRAAAGTAPLYTLTVEQARAADLADIQASAGTPEPVAEVVDQTIPGPGGELPIRVYRPEAAGEHAPVLVYFFGGGWVLGTLDTCDAVCRALANRTGCRTVSVGYRLAPEHPFPAAVHDCQAAVTWIAEHAAELGGDPKRLALAGDSAGGNLAAVTALLSRDRGGPAVACQVLVYPNTDQRADDASIRENTDPYFFNATSVDWYWRHYLASAEDGLDPLASPLRAADLSDLPPALVITAEHDPLRDQGEAYAHRMREAGVAVELTRYPGMVHGFFGMAGTLDAGRKALDQVAAYLTARLG
jgi:acetyl esterase/lipase